jgi:hypothetical protein
VNSGDEHVIRVAPKRGGVYNILMYEVEYFRRTKFNPSGALIGRYKLDLFHIDNAIKEALTSRPAEADGFRLYLFGRIRRTVTIRPEIHDV